MLIQVKTDEGDGLAGLTVYAYTSAGAYTNKKAVTSTTGVATFLQSDFAAGVYKFRADYLGEKFWLENIQLPETPAADLVIPDEMSEITVMTGFGPFQNARVYLYGATSNYLNLYKNTDGNGVVSFDLPTGRKFQFRADILGKQYWSALTEIAPGNINHITVDAGGGVFSLEILKGSAVPLSGVKCYLFSATNAYLNQYQPSDTEGKVRFNLTSGTYIMRIDHLGYQFFTNVYTIPNTLSETFLIPHKESVMTVYSDFAGATTPLSGINCYLFTEAGAYMNQVRTTDSNGQVTFSVPSAKPYKIRADYLSQQFMSSAFTNQDVSLLIPSGDAEITVSNAGAPLLNVRVYAYLSNGTYLNLYKDTDASGKVTFRLPSSGTYKFRADYQGSQFWVENISLTAHTVNPLSLSTGGGSFTLTVLKNETEPLPQVPCYLFSGAGSYLNLTETTAPDGHVTFTLSNGEYKIRVDHLGYQFTTNPFTVPGTLSQNFIIPHKESTVTVSSVYQGQKTPINGIKTYLFTEAGAYMNWNETILANGEASFSLPQDKSYRVRADYLSQQFWSLPFTGTDPSIDIPLAKARVTVTGAGAPLEGVKVYAYLSTGTYLNLFETTDAAGQVVFQLPASAAYRFRADYQGSQFDVENITLSADQETPVSLSTGGGVFTLTVLKTATEPLIGARCYLYTEGGAYLNAYATTDDAGHVSFSLADGSYKIRVDHLGYQFWSNVYKIPDVFSGEFIIPFKDITIHAGNLYQSENLPLEGIKIYLFTQAGAYMNLYETTDASGNVLFNLPANESYKVRADYLSQQFWSEPFKGADTSVSVPMADAEITVTCAGVPVENIQVYAYLASGAYLNLHQNTDSAGKVTFRLPAQGVYSFRADYLGSQFWKNEISVTANQTNPVSLSTGGGLFSLTVKKGEGVPLQDVRCYLFTKEGAYLNRYANTDDTGQVNFSLADGEYMIRVDHLGYQFFTPALKVPDILSSDFVIPHKDVTVSVETVFQDQHLPLDAVKVYLFTGAGSYMNLYQTTNGAGQVLFTLPENKSYKVRADYLSQQFWSSAPFTGQDSMVSIPVGKAEITVLGLGAAPLPNIKLYAYLASGAYLNLQKTTDATGKELFILPAAGVYKFRADYGGNQFWLNDITLPPDQVTPLSLPVVTSQPPVINGQPVSVSVNIGETATFLVTAAGEGLSYQWQRYQENIPGATGPVLTLPDRVYSDSGGSYRCVIKNAAGTVISDTVILTVVDTVSPTLSVEGGDARTTGNAFVDLTGLANDIGSGIQSVVISCDTWPGETFSVSPDQSGGFTSQIPLKPGINHLVIRVTDDTGNTFEKPLSVTYELPEIPAIVILSPKENQIVTNDTITVSGVVYSSLNPEDIRLRIGEEIQFPAGTGGEYTFTFNTIRLVPGQNGLVVNAETLSGNASKTVTVFYQDTPPEETETSCTPTLYISVVENQAIVSGTISCEAGLQSITINGEAVIPEGAAGALFFQHPVTFPEGADRMTVTVLITDLNGKDTTLTKTVLRDTTPPAITLTSAEPLPAINAVLQNPFLLTGTVTEKNFSGVSLNGEPLPLIPIGGANEWHFEKAILLEKGVNPPMTLLAWDEAGNETALDLQFNYTAAASLTILSPKEGSVLMAETGTIELEITAQVTGLSATDTVRAAIDAQPETAVSVSGTTINKTLSINATEGDHHLTLNVYDDVSNRIAASSTRFSIKSLANIPLALTRQEPVNDQTGVEPNAFIAFYFNKAIDINLLSIEVLETVHGKVYPQEEGGKTLTNFSDIALVEIHRDRESVPGTLSFFPENTLAAFYPSRDFGYGGTVYVKLVYDGVELSRSTFTIRPLPTFIQGFVVDETLKPLKDMTVTLKEINRTTVTTADGSFGFGFGEPAAKDIPQGLYTAVIGGGPVNPKTASVSFKLNVVQGQINDAGIHLLPSIAGLFYQRVKSGESQVMLDKGNLTLFLQNTELMFPDGRTEGDICLKYLTLDTVPHEFLRSAMPEGCYMVQPPGIEVYGEIGLSFKLPAKEGSYDYLSLVQERVILLGFDPETFKIVPAGVGLVDKVNHTLVSEGKLVLKQLDYLGYVFTSVEMQPLLKDYAEGLIDLNQLRQAIDKG